MNKTIGVLGGGQLGRMLAEAANRLNIKIIALDKDNAPTKQITAHGDHLLGSFKDPVAIKKLAERCDVLTIEIEHVDVAVLKEIESVTPVHPSPQAIESIQDKYLQKQILKKHGVAVAQSISLDGNTVNELQRVAEVFDFPFMLKARRDAYDGRGNYVVKNKNDFTSALNALKNRELYAERWAPFKMELAVMVVRTTDQVLAFPIVETIHEDSICKLVYAPARGVSQHVSNLAADLAKRAVEPFTGKGVYAVEMFLLPDDQILVNEIAPRPHNSGHYTIEGCYMSQYEAHIHAILDLPIPERRLRLREPSIMLNILGGTTPDAHLRLAEAALDRDGTVHLYGKGAGSPGRKMGHITVTAPSMEEAEKQMQPLVQVFNKIGGKSSEPLESTSKLVSSDSVRPTVAVLMGSDSDLPDMSAGIQILEKLAIPHTVRITSAHRTPELMANFAASAVTVGIKVIIAGAGGAAHLPGMVASHTTLPVIGVPIKSSFMTGLDSILSILNMPRGVPVATVGPSNSTNAALLAARILAIDESSIRTAVQDFATGNAKESLDKDTRLQELGTKEYLEGMSKSKE
jgi:phosphoribosylaminoimidazole carboxylase